MSEYYNYYEAFGYDLVGCLEYNTQSYGPADIDQVLATIEGEHDGADYHWVFTLKDGRSVYLTGWCDYTGWDCRSGADSTFADTLDELILALPDDERDELTRQVAEGRQQTWRETKDQELGVVSGAPLSNTYG